MHLSKYLLKKRPWSSKSEMLNHLNQQIIVVFEYQ